MRTIPAFRLRPEPRSAEAGPLDSIGDDIALADAGLVYSFVCSDDFEAKASVQ